MLRSTVLLLFSFLLGLLGSLGVVFHYSAGSEVLWALWDVRLLAHTGQRLVRLWLVKRVCQVGGGPAVCAALLGRLEEGLTDRMAGLVASII